MCYLAISGGDTDDANKTARSVHSLLEPWHERLGDVVVELPAINDSPNAQVHTSLSGDGKFLTFASWNRPSSGGRWDVQLYDKAGGRLLPLPGLNTQVFDERMPDVSGDGRLIAYSSNSTGTPGPPNIYLYRLGEGDVVANAKMNSAGRDIEPALSSDGRLLAFVSDRPEGQGGLDIYLYDRVADEHLALPEVNSVAHEQSPSLSQDGRFIAFVSERLSGKGERDIFIYDRNTQKLLPTPELNAVQEDFDPCVVVLPSR